MTTNVVGTDDRSLRCDQRVRVGWSVEPSEGRRSRAFLVTDD